MHVHKNAFPLFAFRLLSRKLWCGAVSEEQGECFHQDIRVMEERYQGRWNVSTLAEYCWYLKRDVPEVKHR